MVFLIALRIVLLACALSNKETQYRNGMEWKKIFQGKKRNMKKEKGFTSLKSKYNARTHALNTKSLLCSIEES